MDPVDNFVNEAEAFARWASHGNDTEALAARNGLTLLTSLYLAALKLPDAGTHEEDTPDLTISDEEWHAVYKRASRLPLDYYSEVFNPLPVPSEEPVTASLSDDIADIYRDVVTGLNYYRGGFHQEAAWQWKFSLDYHWGEHITGAIRALHCWLSQNDPCV